MIGDEMPSPTWSGIFFFGSTLTESRKRDPGIKQNEVDGK